jgi:hypothetical protein
MALPLVGLTVLTGYLLNKDNDATTPRRGIVTRTNVVENDKPNGSNIYSSNMANEADYQVFSKSTSNYKDAQHPEISGILPPLFNTYGVSGNTSILSMTPTSANVQGVQQVADSAEMNKLYELNRRANIITSKDAPKIEKRPMFNPVYSGNTVTLQGSDFKTEGMSNVNPLTGLPYETEHKNMVPFFGGVVKQNVENLTNTSTLDLYTGKTDTFIHKKETKPFYTLMKQDINGTPSVTTLEMDRFIPSNYKQNEKLSYEQRISAPKAGTIDNQIRTVAKSVDELRVASKPKLTYEARTVSGQYSSVRGIQPQVNKNLVDTHYENKPEMWLKTTGAVKADASRENFVLKTTSRESTSNESYYGNGYSTQYTKNSQRAATASNTNDISDSIVQDSKRQIFTHDFVRNYNPDKKSDVSDDYGKMTYTAYVTERQLNGETNQFDLNVNQSKVGVRVYNQDDVRPTVKQTTLIGDNSGHVKTHDKGGMSAVDAGLQKWEAKATNKQTLINNKYIGGMKKDEGMGYTVAKYVAKTTGKEIISSNSEYTGNSSAVASAQNYKIQSTYRDPIKTRNVTSVYYTGSSAPSSQNMSISRHNFNNAEINDRQETLISSERASGPQKFQIASGIDSHGELKYTHKMKLKEDSSYRKQQDVNEFMNARLPNAITPIGSIGLQQNKKEDHSETENTRFQPDVLLSQLKNNPYNINGPGRL